MRCRRSRRRRRGWSTRRRGRRRSSAGPSCAWRSARLRGSSCPGCRRPCSMMMTPRRPWKDTESFLSGAPTPMGAPPVLFGGARGETLGTRSTRDGGIAAACTSTMSRSTSRRSSSSRTPRARASARAKRFEIAPSRQTEIFEGASWHSHVSRAHSAPLRRAPGWASARRSPRPSRRPLSSSPPSSPWSARSSRNDRGNSRSAW